jgi:aryl-alcohol dehydrogenase-like predicted oxidoreductase
VLFRSNVDVCLSGPASAEQMETALQALELGPLSDDEMRWMRAVGDNVHRMTTRSWNPFAQRKQ